MKPPEDAREENPKEWMRRAKSNLVRAQQPKPDEAIWEDLCFDAQQAAEKAIKAVLVKRQVDFPKSHDIGELLTLLKQSKQNIPEGFWEADDLTEYATVRRYPTVIPPATEEEYRQAVKIAQEVVDWVAKIIAGN